MLHAEPRSSGDFVAGISSVPIRVARGPKIDKPRRRNCRIFDILCGRALARTTPKENCHDDKGTCPASRGRPGGGRREGRDAGRDGRPGGGRRLREPRRDRRERPRRPTGGVRHGARRALGRAALAVRLYRLLRRHGRRAGRRVLGERLRRAAGRLAVRSAAGAGEHERDGGGDADDDPESSLRHVVHDRGGRADVVVDAGEPPRCEMGGAARRAGRNLVGETWLDTNAVNRAGLRFFRVRVEPK